MNDCRLFHTHLLSMGTSQLQKPFATHMKQVENSTRSRARVRSNPSTFTPRGRFPQHQTTMRGVAFSRQLADRSFEVKT